MEYKRVSQNTLDFLTLHDCVIENAAISNGELKFEFDHIDVLPNHPLNPFDVAKCSGKAALVFENYEVIESILFDTSEVQKQVINTEEDSKRVTMDILDLAKDFEVLSIKKIETSSPCFTYEFMGDASTEYNSDFAAFKLRFSSVRVCWNELISDAWFAG